MTNDGLRITRPQPIPIVLIEDAAQKQVNDLAAQESLQNFEKANVSGTKGTKVTKVTKAQC